MRRMSRQAESSTIRIHGARTHNLRDLTLGIPRDAWTVVCGVSGSGKSSLVLDTLGAESRRRFLGTLRRGALGTDLAPRPDVDRIEGLPPAVSAGFTARAPGARETLGTVAEVTHALRAMFMRAGVPHCPACNQPVDAQPREAIVAALLDLPEGARLLLAAPTGTGPAAVEQAARDGFVRLRVAGAVRRIEDVDVAALDEEAPVEVVVDRLVVKPEAGERFAASVDQALALGAGRLVAVLAQGAGADREHAFADRPWCGRCRVTYPPLSTSLLSFNSVAGACPRCEGRGLVSVLGEDDVLAPHLRLSGLPGRLGPSLPPEARRHLARVVREVAETAAEGRRTLIGRLPARARRALLAAGPARGSGLLERLREHGRFERIASSETCPDCRGARLGPYPRAVELGGSTLPALEALPIAEAAAKLRRLDLPPSSAALVAPALDDARARLAFLEEMGLGYLGLGRAARTLSGGELRRARLAAACAARMSGLLFLLDEPTAGLHPADRAPLRDRLRALVAEGNTVVCVEHDLETLRAADHLLELGPGAGARGGAIVAEGPAAQVLAAGRAPAARALAASPPEPRAAARDGAHWIRVAGAERHNLRSVDCRFPAVGLTALVGVSGAGKSTLALEVIAPAARSVVAGAAPPASTLRRIEGLDVVDRVAVAAGGAARHPRATAGSVLGVLAPIRSLFAGTLEARARGWGPSWFSTNVEGGRCTACKGSGRRAVALRDLPEHLVTCDVCGGSRFRAEAAGVRVRGLSMADVLCSTLEEAAGVFRALPRARRPLRAAVDVGLGYLPLGEATTRLSGGEALRLRLAAALGRGGRARTLYVLDEPCAGLHPQDATRLVDVLLELAAAGNAILAVEHHPLLIRRADHVLELGPGPGAAGGRLVYEGPPAGLLARADSPTGRALGRPHAD